MAERELAVAQANQETIRLSGVRSIDIAMVAIADADSDVDLRTVSVGSAAAGVNMSALTVSARSSVEDLASKAQGLASRVAGVQVPADEVVFVAAGPVRVSELLVGVGDTATGSIMKVTDSVVHVDAGLALGDVALVRAGMSVKIEESDLGIAADGTLVEVAPAPGTNGVDGFHVYARIDVASAPPTLVGASVRLTIPVKSTTGDALAVPVSAVTLSGDGSSKVQVERGGKLLPVAVEALLSAGGYVAIQPVGAPLREGDLVVIGTHPAAKPRATGK